MAKRLCRRCLRSSEGKQASKVLQGLTPSPSASEGSQPALCLPALLQEHFCSRISAPEGNVGSFKGEQLRKKAITPKLLPHLPIAPVLAVCARCCSATCCNVDISPYIKMDGNWYLCQSSCALLGLDHAICFNVKTPVDTVWHSPFL